MKAVVYTRYGPPEVLTLADLPTPVPRAGEVLVKVHAVSVNRSDWEILHGKPLYSRIGGLRRPRSPILGSDIAGRVESVGPGARRFQPGDDVFGDILIRLGGFAEYVAVPERLLGPLPTGLSHEQASCLPQAGAIALHGIQTKGKVHSGQRVLVSGAGGGSGMYAIQLAKLAGAEVTGVDNAEKADFMREMGADHVLDYRAVDFTRNGQSYDLILSLAGDHPLNAWRSALATGGRLLYVGGSTTTLLRVLLFGGRRIGVLAVPSGVHHLTSLIDLCRNGVVATVIDRRFPLAEVPDALRYVGEGHARGKVVVTVD